MKVIINFPSYTYALTKTHQIALDMDERACVCDLLKVLTQRYGERFIDLLHTSELGHTPIWATVTIDGQEALVDGLATSKVKLKDGAVVVLLGPVGGG
jgi:molybdopterin converting factor small subunit